MSAFDRIYSATLKREGGYVLSNLKGDRGGQTYAGIARNMNPKWAGWAHVDRGETPPTSLVREFYYTGYWIPLKGSLLPEEVAMNVFDMAVNTSAPGRPTVAAKLLQLTVEAEPDGVIGPKTIEAANMFPAKHFPAYFFVTSMARYRDICRANPAQRQWLFAWLNRSLERLS